jgi:hypothetical protein
VDFQLLSQVIDELAAVLPGARVDKVYRPAMIVFSSYFI